MRVPLFVWIVVVAFSGVWISLGSMITPSSKGHDFLNLYTAGSLALDGKFATLHDPAVQLEREQRLVPSTKELIPFGRPLFYSLALAPLATIPFASAFWVFIVSQSLLLIGCWAWAARRFGPRCVPPCHRRGRKQLPEAAGPGPRVPGFRLKRAQACEGCC